MGLRGLLATSLAGLLFACDVPEPTVTLHTLMLTMELDSKAIEGGSLAPDESLPRLRKLSVASKSEAYEDYLRGTVFDGDENDFRAKLADYTSKLDRAIDAAEQGDAMGFRRAYMSSRLACEVCHAAHRPELK